MVQQAGHSGPMVDIPIAMFPEFPESRPISLDDKPVFDSVLAANPPEVSTYTFTNIFAWGAACGTELSRLGDHIIVFRDTATCLEPLGKAAVGPVIEDALRRADRDITFERVSARAVAELDGSGLLVEPDRDNWDYVYMANDLIDLSGRKYDGKRNQIARARDAVDYQYFRLDGRSAMECEEFAEYWCEERSCETVEGLRKESCAVYQMLANYEALGISGGAIRAGGAIVAFSLGEALNRDTFVVHVEKADGRIEGLYQLINNEFCKAEANGFTYVNREQDLGIPGLRKAKESYHPVKMVETFRVRKV